MSNPSDFLNFETTLDSVSELASQNLLDYLNRAPPPDGELVNVSNGGIGNISSLPLLSDQMPIPSPSVLNVSDDFLELLKTNAGQVGTLPLHGAEVADDNGVTPDASALTRSISEVTMDVLHRTPFANVAKREDDDSASIPNALVAYGQPAPPISATSVIQMVRQENLMPAPSLPQTADAYQYVAKSSATTLPQEGHFFSLPLQPRQGSAGAEAHPVEVNAKQKAEALTVQPIVRQPGEVQGLANGFVHVPSGFPSGTLQAARQSDSDKLCDGNVGRGSRGGSVVRRVLKRMGTKSSEVPSLLSRVSHEQSKQSSAEAQHQLDAEERRGKKRKMEGVENEEELKKIRRVRNRESVEKCRAKQRRRLEKLEEEDKALREECKLMRQMAEVFQEKWKLVAEEYRKICGKDAGECPMVIPPKTALPEAVTLPSADRS
eukprot:TRINITY_DN55481_c0_g1_i1.p1 TRINITY_DN55481_c0_g1~~TRINITY_DN55481_c0_g1_i1.p1  ORF type:complete len:434 (+),score=80.18 TRINITY_DN55481_c0_g1_i1:566-1867(+)